MCSLLEIAGYSTICITGAEKARGVLWTRSGSGCTQNFNMQVIPMSETCQSCSAVHSSTLMQATAEGNTFL